MDSDWEAAVSTALRAGDPSAAFAALRPHVEDSDLAVVDAPLLRSPLDLLGEVLAAGGQAELGATCARLSRQPNDPELLYQAGFGLYELALLRVAQPLLTRANRLSPRDPKIVAELGAVLEGLMDNRAAARLLDEADLVHDIPFFAYLSGFNHLMSGEVDLAEERLRLLAPEFAVGGPGGRFRRRKDPAVVGDDSSELGVPVRHLAGMLARARTLQLAEIVLDDQALTAWHAVINGTLLTHESPYGRDDGMQGRYAYVSDSPELMRLGIEQLVRLVQQRGEHVEQVLYLPGDRMSAVLAGAAGKLLGLHVADWEPGAEPGLVVAWQLTADAPPELLRELSQHRPEELLFVHASCWTDPLGLAPDVTTFLHQVVVSPYAGGAPRVDASGGFSTTEPDDRPLRALVADLLTADPLAEPPSTLPQEIAMALSDLPEPYRLGIGRGAGARCIERTGSPVQSSRFL